jgi:DHA2 family lincomycin resistance protein-like MFS transporter
MQRDVVAVSCDLSMLELEQIFAEKGISGAPVVSDTGELMGIVSNTDVLRKLTSILETRSTSLREALASVRLYEIMTPQVLTVGPGEEVEAVAGKMSEARIHRVIVTGDSGEILGIVTSLDLVGVLASQ